MQHNLTEWEYSNVIAQEEVKYEPLSEGEHHLQIVDATFIPDTKRYSLTLRSLDSGEQSQITYFMLNKDGTDNNKTLGILNSLKYAIYGLKGVLAPCDTINGIVYAEVTLSKPNAEGKVYRNIYHFDPVTSDYFALAKESVTTIEGQFTVEEVE